MVSRLDDQVLLTPQQRDKIYEALSAKWQDQWEKWSLMQQVYGDRYFPVVPDQYVVPHLNAEQKTVWQGLQKVDIGYWGGQQHQEGDDEKWWMEGQANDEATGVDAPLGKLKFRAGEIFR